MTPERFDTLANDLAALAEAGDPGAFDAALRAALAEAAAREREACARLADEWAGPQTPSHATTARVIGAAIRGRGLSAAAAAPAPTPAEAT